MTYDADGYDEEADNRFMEKVDEARFYDVVHFSPSNNMNLKCAKWIKNGVPCMECPGPNKLNCYEAIE